MKILRTLRENVSNYIYILYPWRLFANQLIHDFIFYMQQFINSQPRVKKRDEIVTSSPPTELCCTTSATKQTECSLKRIVVFFTLPLPIGH